MSAAESSGAARLIGWLTSVCLHAMLAFGALIVTQRLTLAPHSAPFTWNVTLWATPPESLRPSAPSPTIQTPVAKVPSKAPSTHASVTPAGGGISTGAVKGDPELPASNEAIGRRYEASPALDSSPSVENSEQQEALNQVVIPAQLVPSASPLESRQSEMPSELDQTTQPLPREAASSVPGQPPSPASVARPDYAWLSETIMRRMQELKRYPAEARIDHAEGKVVLKAVIRSNGAVETVEVFQSSGHQSLDRAAVELLTQAGPFQFPRPLEKPQMTVKIPMNYRLE
jgi:periplasmic protein TonB